MKRLFSFLLFSASLLAQVTVNGSVTHQTWDGMGASDWSSAEALTGAQADMFFSPTAGIGLSFVSEQANEFCGAHNPPVLADVSDLTTLQAAVARGAKVWVSTLAPPVSLKTANAGHGPSCSEGTVPSSNWASWATWIVQWIQLLQANGVPVYGVSPINEPEISDTTNSGNYTPNNIGSYYLSTTQLRDFIKNNLAPALMTAGLSTKIIIAAEGQWFVPGTTGAGNAYDWAASCLADTTCKNDVSILSVHGYGYGPHNSSIGYYNAGACCSISSTAPESTNSGQLWQSEVNYAQGPFTGAIADGLIWGKMIHDYIQNGITSFQYWMLVGAYAENEALTDSSFNPAKRMYVFGNWSKYVRPGWQRIDATANPASGVFVSAFKDPATGNFAIVAVNNGGSSSSQTFTLTSLPSSSTVTPVRTSATESLTSLTPLTVTAGAFSATLAANSVTTFTGTAPGNATYYVDWTNGNDANAGTAKGFPWKHAPGMNGASGIAASTTPNAGDSVILRGCVTWPNSAFSWTPKGTGTSGSAVYYGVDQTWWDSTVSGCASAWNRPKFDLGNLPVTDNLQRIIMTPTPFITLDNFEIVNVSDRDSQFSGENETHVFDVEGEPVTVENMYIHGWQQQFAAIGTGNLVSGLSTVTGFHILSYSPMTPSSAWTSLSSNIIAGDLTGGNIPEGGNGAQISSIVGSCAVGGAGCTITWTGSGNATGNCTGCTISVGGDYLRIIAGDSESQVANQFFLNNVIDGSDSLLALVNPYSDCGTSESNNQWCATTGVFNWHNDGIFRNNVIRYVQAAAVGRCGEWSGNLIEDIRFSANYAVHTNAIECLDTDSGTSLMFNNVMRHTNKQNSNAPGGLQSIGLFNQINPPDTSSTSYVFNNVVYNTLQNNWLGLGSGTTGCQANCGTIYVFNNTALGGPDLNSGSLTPSYQETGPTPCPSFLKACTVQNNHWITTNGTPCGSGAGADCNTSSGTYTGTHNITVAPTSCSAGNCNAGGSLESSTSAYSTPSGGSTINAGLSIASICTAIGGTAGTACGKDTTYGASYNTANHTAVTNARVALIRPATPDVGAYQFNASAPNVSPTTLGPWTNTQIIAKTLTATNFTGTITWSLLSGTQPTGLGGTCITGTTGSTCTLAGTLSAAGSFTFTIRATDGTNTVDTPFTSLAVNAVPSITTSSLPGGTTGIAYSQSIATSGGTPAVTVGLSSGTLPTGLTLAGNILSGTPTVAGSYTFTLAPTDANNVTGSGVTYSGVTIVNNPNPSILNFTFCPIAHTYPGSCAIPSTTVNSRLVVVFHSYNSCTSTPTMTSVTDGGDTFTQVPNARTINTLAGNSSWNDTWTTAIGAGGKTSVTLTPSATCIGDVAIWEIANASVYVSSAGLSSQAATSSPSGPSLSVGSNVILLGSLHPASNAAPSSVNSPWVSDTMADDMAYAHLITSGTGSFGPTWNMTSFTFAASTAAFVSGNAPSVSPGSIGPWTNTQVITSGSAGGTLTASNFSGTVTWSRLSGTQPTGLAGTCITGTTGNTCTLVGTLSAAGAFSFTIRATDGTSTVDTLFNVTVNGVPQITTLTLPSGAVNQTYSTQLQTSGGTGSITYTLTSGSLPNGLSLTGFSGVISGTPTLANNFPFTVTATDANGIASAAANLSITINSACAVTPTTLTGITGRSAVSVQFVATGCNSSTFTLAGGGGSLTGSGLSLSSSGLLSGVGAIQATYSIEVDYDTAKTPITFTIGPSVVPGSQFKGRVTTFGKVGAR